MLLDTFLAQNAQFLMSAYAKTVRTIEIRLKQN